MKRLLSVLLPVAFLSLAPALSCAGDGEKDFRTRSHHVSEEFYELDNVKAEIIFGKELSARILGKYRAYREEKLTQYVNLVGKGIALNAGRPDIEFRFAVLDTETINAFAAPGGYIFITKGALKEMRDESELASVLAHEVAHVSEKHIVKELEIKGGDNSQVAGLMSIISGSSDTMRVAFAQMVDKAVEILLERGLKKSDEFDSDRIGATLAVSAGYDPSALGRYLKRIAARAGDDTKQLRGTHPGFDERLSALDRVLADNSLVNVGKPTVKERFAENVKFD